VRYDSPWDWLVLSTLKDAVPIHRAARGQDFLLGALQTAHPSWRSIGLRNPLPSGVLADQRNKHEGEAPAVRHRIAYLRG